MNMKAKRKELNITLEDLSKLTKISKGDLSLIENNKANPTKLTLERIAKALNTDLIILFK
jgi:transcriptional regulator with XRE-family HTH domain